MKTFDLKIMYKGGGIDDYYTRLAGNGWETDEAATPEEALQEMRENDPETFEDIENNENIECFWAEEIPSVILKGYSPDNEPVEFVWDPEDGNVNVHYGANVCEPWNDERYETADDARRDIKLPAMNEGYRFC